jgi:hypothetical protein
MIAVKMQNIMVEGAPGRELFMLMKGALEHICVCIVRYLSTDCVQAEITWVLAHGAPGEVEMLKDGIRMGFLGEGAFFGECS